MSEGARARTSEIKVCRRAISRQWCRTFAWLAGVLLAMWLPRAIRAGQPASPPVANAAPVQLPPMLVEESVSGVPWLYANVDGTEFLSRCSESVTVDLVEAWVRQMQLVRALVPDAFLGRMDVPSIFVLYSQDVEQSGGSEIQRELQDARGRSAGKSGAGVNIAPSMRLSDRDMHASIAYIDESLFEGAGLSVAPSHVRYLLTARVPELPDWVVDGVERAWRHADFVLQPITFQPFVWLDPSESGALAGDAARPRAILPAPELFAVDTARALESRHPRHLAVRNATEALLFRWAMVSGGAMREAYWKFAANAAEGPVTEEMFVSAFGFDFAELRDRLSDYLPRAVAEEKWIDPGKLGPRPKFDVARATPDQIARVRGEWERLAIAHVQRRLPQVREPYLAHARRTVGRAYRAGDRDPRLLATMGLIEIDAGNDRGAREFLEPAVAAGVVRPRAYYELARLRWADLRRGPAAAKSFAKGEVTPVVQPLAHGLAQSPPLPESFALLAETWTHCAEHPDPSELALLERGVRLFSRRPDIGLPVAQVLARMGRPGEAAAVLERCAPYAFDDGARERIARLQHELTRSTPAQPTSPAGP